MSQINHTALFLLILSASIAGCKTPINNVSKREEAIKEIKETEESFAALSLKEGVKNAFAAYSDDSASIRSNDSLITGKAAIEKYYAQPFFKSVSLQWQPDFVDASESGELGYTYGHYTFTLRDGKGKKKVTKGIFHSVWKKKNGKWKFVWDS